MTDSSLYDFFLPVSHVFPIYPVCMGIRYREIHIIRPTGHYDYQWLHCVKGKGVIIVDNTEYIIGKGMGFLLRKGIPHEYYPLYEPWETHWVTFNGKTLDIFLDSLEFGEWDVFQIDDVPSFEECFQELLELSASKNIQNQGWIATSSLFKLLMYIRCNMTPYRSLSSSEMIKRMKVIIDFIIANYSNPNLTLGNMANLLNLNSDYFCRLFKKTFNIGPCEYLTMYRLQKAKEILFYNSKEKISAVAKMVGFSSVNYFITVFKKHFGDTPNEFRKISHQGSIIK